MYTEAPNARAFYLAEAYLFYGRPPRLLSLAPHANAGGTRSAQSVLRMSARICGDTATSAICDMM
jgi:hypothetical protein